MISKWSKLWSYNPFRTSASYTFEKKKHITFFTHTRKTCHRHIIEITGEASHCTYDRNQNLTVSPIGSWMFFFFFLCIPSSGVHHFWWDFYICDSFESNHGGCHILSSWLVHGGCVVVASIHPSRTWMSGSFETVRWNECVHRLDLGFSSHWKNF